MITADNKRNASPITIGTDKDGFGSGGPAFPAPCDNRRPWAVAKLWYGTCVMYFAVRWTNMAQLRLRIDIIRLKRSPRNVKRESGRRSPLSAPLHTSVRALASASSAIGAGYIYIYRAGWSLYIRHATLYIGQNHPNMNLGICNSSGIRTVEFRIRGKFARWLSFCRTIR